MYQNRQILRLTMPIEHTKKMHRCVSHKIGCDQVRVLVGFLHRRIITFSGSEAPFDGALFFSFACLSFNLFASCLSSRSIPRNISCVSSKLLIDLVVLRDPILKYGRSLIILGFGIDHDARLLKTVIQLSLRLDPWISKWLILRKTTLRWDQTRSKAGPSFV